MNSFLKLMSAAILAGASLPAIAHAQAHGGAIDVATIGEPPTLDPMTSTADLVGIITQHMFETLYTFDGNWAVAPLLAADLPEISEDGLTYTIALRDGVTFHDGSAMTSEDVVASLERWLRIASRGLQTAEVVESVTAIDDLTVEITLSTPYAPLLSLLSLNNSAAIVIPAEIAGNDVMEDYIGTGPYQLGERRPDQFIQLTRFEDYASRDEDASGYGGGRAQYLDEIRFVPVPDANTRIEGAVAGQFDYVDSIPVEAYDRIASGQTEPVMLAPFGWPVFVMNTAEGVMADLTTRKAVQAGLAPHDMLLAAFGSEEFFAAEAPMYPDSYVWHTEAGIEPYNPSGDMERAASLLAESEYDGSPVRILTSRQYEFHYTMAQVAEAYLEAAGFDVQLDVVEWATLTQRRTDPALWDIYITHSPFLPEPSLTGIMSDTSPGWWVSDAKHAALGAFNAEADPDRRVELWSAVQEVIYEEVPAFKVGNFNAVAAQSSNLEGMNPAPWPYFWNAYLAE